MKHIVIVSLLLFFVLSCNQAKEIKHHDYENQIGDTPFDLNLDDSNFKFCDSTNVLHKRALVRYKGGTKALEEELIENYKFKPKYESFSGYFVIRFAINCNNETGRFRMQILNSTFKETNYLPELGSHILSITKALKGWNHAFYQGKYMDCYRFIIIKMENGKIQKI
jgi:hypothetical protein